MLLSQRTGASRLALQLFITGAAIVVVLVAVAAMQ
jgi:hypothetical protein